MKNLVVSSSPHIVSDRSTKKIMSDVLIALTPAIIASVCIYGLYSLLVLFLSIGSCVLAEFLYNLVRKKEQTIYDLSAIVTGTILALNLPPVVPFYVPIVGGFFAIIIVKMLFGGIGRNFANPAITARIFLLLSWGSLMTSFVSPVNFGEAGVMGLFSYFENIVNPNLPDAITSATPLAFAKGALQNGANPLENINMLDMFLGKTGGSAGEVSALAILIGGAYLLIKKIIDWKIPAIYITSTVIFTAIFYANTGYAGEYVYSYLFGGGLLFGAFFMATDYATSPNTFIGTIIYSLGLGLLTVLIRKFSPMDEGVSFAILLMNIVVPLFDKIIPKPFGAPKKTVKDLFLKLKTKRKSKDGEVCSTAAQISNSSVPFVKEEGGSDGKK